MFLKYLNTVAENEVTFELANNTHKLLFRHKFKVNKGAFSGITTQVQRAKKLVQLWFYSLTGTISITKYTQGANKQLTLNMPLGDLAEICANNEGVISINPYDTTQPTYDTYEATFSVELNNSGSIKLNKETFIQVKLQGFTNPNTDNAGINFETHLTINSFQSYVANDEHIKYSPIVCQAGETKSFDCNSHYEAYFPYSLQKATLTSAAGETPEVVLSELESISADLSDAVFLCDGIQLLFYRWRALPIQLVTKIQVQLAAPQTTMYISSNKNYV